MSNTLKDLKIGDLAIIRGFVTEEIPTKLYDMGLIPGAEFIIKNKAPFGGPICLNITANKSILAIRKNEAGLILIDKK